MPILTRISSINSGPSTTIDTSPLCLHYVHFYFIQFRPTTGPPLNILTLFVQGNSGIPLSGGGDIMGLSTCPIQNWELHGITAVSRFVNIDDQYFDFSWSPILRSLSRYFVTCSEESGQNPVTSELAFPILLLLRISFSFQSNFAFH